ncbi:MAG: periplasmic heavy metal sensor [Defluviimonas sp.]|nr:periplasmic heavy metal sensor [Defluviimonas sp.]
MTDAGQIPAAPRSPRWMRILLVASLALNLAGIGMVAGAVLGHSRRPDRPMMVHDLGFGPYTEALSREDRRALRNAFLERAPDLRRLRALMKADFDRLLTILRNEPYDAEAAAGVIAAQAERARRGFDLGHELLLERLKAMTPEERRAFAARLEQAMTRPSGHPGNRPPPGAEAGSDG